MSTEILVTIWVFVTGAIITWIYRRNKHRVYFYGGFALILVGFATVYNIYGFLPEVINKYQDLAAQLIIIASAVLGANFISYSVTMKENA